jgi:hypothetical protein
VGVLKGDSGVEGGWGERAAAAGGLPAADAGAAVEQLPISEALASAAPRNCCEESRNCCEESPTAGAQGDSSPPNDVAAAESPPSQAAAIAPRKLSN